MAADEIASLALRVDSTQATRGSRALDDLSRSATKAEGSAKRMGTGFDEAAAALRRLAGPVAGALSVRQVAAYADAYTGLQNRLRLVTEGQQQLATATKDVFDIAMSTAQNVDSVAQVYQRFAQNAGQLGLSLADVAALTETVSQAVAISGADASAAAAALTQFGQALASGTLRGEELNSVMEQTPGLAKAIADGLGVPIGMLRQLAADGEITSERLIEALRRAAAGVEDQFSTRVLTIGQGFENLRTAATEAIGTIDTGLGASSSIANGLDSLAKALRDSADSAADLRREADAVREFFSVIGDGLQLLDDFAGKINALTPAAGVATTEIEFSFRTMFLNTAKEIDFIAGDFQGFFNGLYRAAQTMGWNVEAAFTNMWAAVLEGAQVAVNELLEAYNKVAERFGQQPVGLVVFADGVRKEFRSISDAFVSGYREAAVGLGAYEKLVDRLSQRDIQSAIEGWEADYLGGGGGNSPAGGSGGKGKGKGKAKKKSERSYIADGIDDLGIRLGLWTLDDLEIKAASTFEKLSDYSREGFDNMGEFAREASRNMQDFMGDNLYDALRGDFDNIGKSFGDLLARMGAELLSSEFYKIMLGNYGSTGSLGGLLGMGAQWLFGGKTGTALGSTFGLSGIWGGVRANGGPTQAGRLYEVNERGPELYTEGGRTFLMSGARGGYVSPMDAQSASPRITINSYGGADVQARQMSDGEILIEVDRRIARQTPEIMQSQFRQSNSRGSRAITDNFNMTRKR